MLKRHSEFFKNLLFLCDLGLITSSWLAAYAIRFHGGIFPVTKGIPPLTPYLWLLIPIVLIWGMAFRSFNLYRPRRLGSRLAEFIDIAKANTLSVLILVAVTFFVKQFEYSRLVLLLFWSLNLVLLGASRMMFREALRFARRCGYNRRYALILGAGKLGQQVLDSLRRHPELGIHTRGFLSLDSRDRGHEVNGVPVVGTFDDLVDVVKKDIDMVFVCLPPDAADRSEKLLSHLATTSIEVKFVPSISEYLGIRVSAEMFEGLPIITLQGTPLYGWNVVIKRATDVVGSMLALFLASPFFVILPLLIYVTSGRPILYRQVRMGLDGRPFQMLKFRTMSIDAEKETGPVWAMPNDPRRTRLGSFLRKTSLDELPQFWNVLRGDMSLVGPRPERPEFLDEFRRRLPQYMLRHKMKSGITGWAQVNGLRGNTSLEKRLEYDLYYIEHWSLWFDIKIMLLTMLKGFVNTHAY